MNPPCARIFTFLEMLLKLSKKQQGYFVISIAKCPCCHMNFFTFKRRNSSRRKMYENIRKSALPCLAERHRPLHIPYYIAQPAENQECKTTKKQCMNNLFLCNRLNTNLHFHGSVQENASHLCIFHMNIIHFLQDRDSFWGQHFFLAL